MKFKSLILIIFGILIAAYPFVKDLYTLSVQKKLLKEWEEEKKIQQLDRKAAENISDASGKISDFHVNAEEDLNNAEMADISENDENNKNDKKFVTLGELKIDKIGLILPILDGATPEILKMGAGKLPGSTDIGKTGNTAISAHRSHAYGRNFNRLNELEEGDIVIISTHDADYTYEVFNIQVVEPDDVSLLKKSKTESILTLITCHPLYTASHRLIVQARLISVMSLDENY